eukprot:1270923-Pyramimonas_sp.AAC.1
MWPTARRSSRAAARTTLASCLSGSPHCKDTSSMGARALTDGKRDAIELTGWSNTASMTADGAEHPASMP